MRRLVIVGLSAAAACALVLAAANAIVLVAARGDVVKDPAKAPRAEAALVLGAQVYRTAA
jgi:vancomycin permeability regulator SanA